MNITLAHPIGLAFGVPLYGGFFQFCPEANRTFACDVIGSEFALVPSTE